jgi:hypothetical protein
MPTWVNEETPAIGAKESFIASLVEKVASEVTRETGLTPRESPIAVSAR